MRLMTKSKKENMYKAYKGKQWSTEKYEIVEVSTRKPYRYKLKMGEKKRVWRYRDQISNAEGPTDTKSEALLAGLTATGKVKAVPKPKAKKPKAAKPSREAVLALRSEARKAEERVKKINDMRDKLAKKLADPALYEDTRKGELETWNKKYAEVMEALGRAEALWMAALEKLEQAEAA